MIQRRKLPSLVSTLLGLSVTAQISITLLFLNLMTNSFILFFFLSLEVCLI